jgi:DNA-binding NarL/FixJ family response regulator
MRTGFEHNQFWDERMERARLLIAEDHPLLVEGLRRVLEPEFDIVDAVMDGQAAVAAFERLRPDVVLLDVGLPLLNGIEVARHVKAISTKPKIVFVTMQTDRIYIEEAFRAGASAYVLKQSVASELKEAIRTVLRGRYYVSPSLATKSGLAPSHSSTEPNGLFGGRLTSRQREVLQLIADGKGMKEIATILNISVRTVEFHKNGIMLELGVHSTAEMIRYALDHGIAVSERLPRQD